MYETNKKIILREMQEQDALADESVNQISVTRTM
jgi:hypothetical protein